jgi:hypothetical protein
MKRLESVDALRGSVMVPMALDSVLDRGTPRSLRPMLTFGRLDQFPFTRPPGWGFNLPAVDVIWAGIVAAMYPLCARVALMGLHRSAKASAER